MFWARLSPAKTIRANLNHLWLGGLNDYPHRWHQCGFWICWEIESPNMRFVRSISEWEPQKSNTPAFYKSEYSSYQPGFLENILDILGFNSTDPLNFGAPKLFQDAVPGAPCIPDVAGSSARDRNLDIHSFMRNWRFHHLFFFWICITLAWHGRCTHPVYPSITRFLFYQTTSEPLSGRSQPTPGFIGHHPCTERQIRWRVLWQSHQPPLGTHLTADVVEWVSFFIGLWSSHRHWMGFQISWAY